MFCPNCVEKMIPNKKKLGEFKNWLVCPKCGYRSREQKVVDTTPFTDEIKKKNMYTNKFREI